MHQPKRRSWRFGWLNLSIALFLCAGVALLLYPGAASWVSQRNQSNVVSDQTRANSERARSDIDAALDEAHRYNDLLESGAILSSGAHVAEGIGLAGPQLDYWKVLTARPTGALARLQIPSIDLDLPVYHGTADATLLRGVGHLQGTSLPVGGEGTRAVLTGHRGLADATMFTNLNRVKEGDVFSVSVLGEVFSYRVFEILTVAPEDTEEIRAVPGRDLMTLITCTPLGVNTHRILVTGERIDPAPAAAIDALGADPEIPGFPWWIPLGVAGIGAVAVWYWRSGYATVRPAAEPGLPGERAA